MKMTANCSGSEKMKEQQQQDSLLERERTRVHRITTMPNSKMEVTATHIRQRSTGDLLTKRNMHKTITSAPPGARCGEIFVLNNARKWTFVCTFCNKMTRDIGHFICHIKMKHLDDTDYGSDDSDDSCYADYSDKIDMMDGGINYQDHDQDVSKPNALSSDSYCGNKISRLRSSHAIEVIPIQCKSALRGSMYRFSKPHTQTIGADPVPVVRMNKSPAATSTEYLDCGRYLDVNVHTDPEELGNVEDQSMIRQLDVNERTGIMSQHQQQKENEIAGYKHKKISKIYKPDHQATSKQHYPGAIDTELTINGIGMGDQMDNEAANNHCDADSTMLPTSISNGSVTMPTDKSNKNDYPLYDLTSAPAFTTPHDDEYDDDYDNQLLITPTIFEPTSSKAEVKTKRRQIRGTAYCTLCNKTFQYYSLYRNHMIKHSNETPFKCNLCRKGFKSKQAIRYHMNTHTRMREKQHKCQICSASFFTENQYVTHILTHENESTFPCVVCGQIFETQDLRDTHLKTHKDERPFKCEFCSKLFRLRHHLSNHLKMHRQYKCDYCKEEFTSAVHLRKPYACVQCGSASKNDESTNTNSTNKEINEADIDPLQFSLKSEPDSLKSSMDCADTELSMGAYDSDQSEEEEKDAISSRLRSDKKKPFTCKDCPRSYSHLSGLNFHIRKKHR